MNITEITAPISTKISDFTTKAEWLSYCDWQLAIVADKRQQALENISTYTLQSQWIEQLATSEGLQRLYGEIKHMVTDAYALNGDDEQVCRRIRKVVTDHALNTHYINSSSVMSAEIERLQRHVWIQLANRINGAW